MGLEIPVNFRCTVSYVAVYLLHVSVNVNGGRIALVIVLVDSVDPLHRKLNYVYLLTYSLS